MSAEATAALVRAIRRALGTCTDARPLKYGDRPSQMSSDTLRTFYVADIWEFAEKLSAESVTCDQP